MMVKIRAAPAIARATGLASVLPTEGSQTVSGKGAVPLIEATPGRFHGPKMRYTARPWATKFSPSPAKISLIRKPTLRPPASSAHSVPPSTPASSPPMMAGAPGATSCSRRRARVAAIPPAIIWPSMPRLYSPALKVKISPQAHKVRGTRVARTRANWSGVPKAPPIIAPSTSTGDWPDSTMMAAMKSRPTAMAPKR